MVRRLTKKYYSLRNCYLENVSGHFLFWTRTLLGDDKRKTIGGFCDKNNFDVIFTCETWLHKECLDSKNPLAIYQLYLHEKKRWM